MATFTRLIIAESLHDLRYGETVLSYTHTQRAPLCIVLYAFALYFFLMGWILRKEDLVWWLLPASGVLMLGLAASFHYLKVEDEGDRLSVAFGPVPLFRRTVRYNDLASAERGRTTILDGWGIHRSLRGGWVWNIWGRDCVVLRLQNGKIFRVGTDDVDQLLTFLRGRMSHLNR